MNKEIATIKLSWYFWSFALFEYLHISSEQLAILWILMVIDFILWVGKQFRLDKKEITSHKAWLWAMKKWTTMLLIWAIGCFLKWVWVKDALPYMQGMLSILITAEIYSIIQNSYTIRTWKIVQEYDVISIALQSFWNIVKKQLDKYLGNLNNDNHKNIWDETKIK